VNEFVEINEKETTKNGKVKVELDCVAI